MNIPGKMVTSWENQNTHVCSFFWGGSKRGHFPWDFSFFAAQEMAEGKVYRWPGAAPRIPTEQQMMEGQLLGCAWGKGWMI